MGRLWQNLLGGFVLREGLERGPGSCSMLGLLAYIRLDQVMGCHVGVFRRACCGKYYGDKIAFPIGFIIAYGHKTIYPGTRALTQ